MRETCSVGLTGEGLGVLNPITTPENLTGCVQGRVNHPLLLTLVNLTSNAQGELTAVRATRRALGTLKQMTWILVNLQVKFRAY